MALNTGVSSLGYGASVQWSTELPMQKCVLGNTVCSPCFTIGKDPNWCLRFYFFGEWSEFRLFNTQERNLEMPYRVTTYIQDCSQAFTPFISSVRTVRKSGDFLLRTRSSDLTKYTCNYTRKTIFCLFQEVFSFNYSKQNDWLSILIPSASRDLQHLSSDFTSFMKDETFSDVKLKCGDCTFSAHKSVLAARSEVFAAMFRNKMAESETGVVHVQDLDPDVLEQLLKYMYSGKSPDVCLSIAQRLYQASDKYAVYALKKTCSEYMLASLTQQNCLELLVLADRHTDEEFKEAVSRFVARHQKHFSEEKWSRFKKEHLELAVVVLEMVCRSAQQIVFKRKKPL